MRRFAFGPARWSARGTEERAAFLQLSIRRGFELETMQLASDRKGNKGSVV